MDEADLAALGADLVTLDVVKGQVLTEQDAMVDYVYFPETADLANVMLFKDGRQVETANVACEGISGLAAFLAKAPCAWRVVVQQAGKVVRVEADAFRRRVEANPDLMLRCLQLTHDNQSQAAQTAACNAVHSIAQRLSRWLLLIQDRTNSLRITVTQDDLAAILGVQRTSINAAVLELKSSGGIESRRGWIGIKNREALKTIACECYDAQRARSEALGIITRLQAAERS